MNLDLYMQNYIKEWCEKNLTGGTSKPKKLEASTNWFLTINPIDNIQTFHKDVLKKVKKKSIEKYAFCYELTKKGVPHLHLVVQFKMSKHMSEFKRVFNFEKVMDRPKYDIKQFDKLEKILPYLKKDREADILFRLKNNIQDIYTNI